MEIARFLRKFAFVSMLPIVLNTGLTSAAALTTATITVDENCSLAQAIEAANIASIVAECSAGSPDANTIVLTDDVTLDRAYSSTPEGANGLPLITSSVTILGEGFTIARADGGSVPNFRLFQVAEGASLRLENVTLRNGRVVGTNGGRGRSSATPGAEGADGEMGSVGFIMSGPGGTGGAGGNGSTGRAGGAGGAAYGGAIYNSGTLELVETTLEANQVRGGNGGAGGNASRGGVGGYGGSPGVPIPLILFAILGAPGAGGTGGIGGTGGTGGRGGVAAGGAVYNDSGLVAIEASTFSGNEALGGTAGAGGAGGAGGGGGPGALGQQGTIGPGGRGGRGGEGGRGGRGGASEGGALYNDGGIVTLMDARLVDNRALAGTSGAGGPAGAGADGGLSAGSGGFGGPGGRGGVSLTARGGAIFHAGGELVVERSTFLGNGAAGGAGGAGNDAGAGGGGGAAYSSPAGGIEAATHDLILSMAGITVSGGAGGTGGDGGAGGTADGGAIFSEEGTLTISRSSLSNNMATGGTGGAGGRGALEGLSSAMIDALELEDIIIRDASGNGGPGESGPASGGALWMQSGEQAAQILNSTIANNIATTSGGGLVSVDSVEIRSSIVAQNTAADAADISGTVDSLDNNLIGSTEGVVLEGLTGRSVPNADPQLLPVQNNGGRTETMALRSTSPALNRGLCTDAQDQRGYYQADGFCDIGAYELGATLQRPVLPTPVDELNPVRGTDAVRAALPQGVYTRLIALNGAFIRSAAEIGNLAVLDLGVIAAVDVFTLDGTSATGATICFAGSGNVIFLDAGTAPRVARHFDAVPAGEYTCAVLPRAGTLVLVER